MNVAADAISAPITAARSGDVARVVCCGRALAFDVGFGLACDVGAACGCVDAAFDGAAFVLLARGVDAAFGELRGAGDGAAFGGPWGGGGAEETSVVLQRSPSRLQ